MVPVPNLCVEVEAVEVPGVDSRQFVVQNPLRGGGRRSCFRARFLLLLLWLPYLMFHSFAGLVFWSIFVGNFFFFFFQIYLSEFCNVDIHGVWIGCPSSKDVTGFYIRYIMIKSG